MAELEKIDEDEDEEHTKDSDRERDSDSMATNIKSKKAFSMAINDKSMPPAIKRLSRSATFLITFLISLAIAEYAIVHR